MWKNVENVVHPTLKGLGEILKSVAVESREPNTVKSYNAAFKRWKKWAKNFPEIEDFPASPTYVALYLTSIMQNANSPAPVTVAFYGIAWAHRLAGVEDPTQHSLPRTALEAAKRRLGRETVKKEPVTPEMLCAMIETSADNLKGLRVCTMCVLAYVGFLRFDELSAITRSDIHFYQAYFELFIGSAKNDVYRSGNRIVIARTGSSTCPYNLLQKYLLMADIRDNSTEYIFRALTFFKAENKYKLRSDNKKLSYTTTREVVQQRLQELGLDKQKFGLHSLRAGGATRAARAGVPDRLFKRHGRWRSEKAKDAYVDDDLDTKLKVSLSLGL